MKKLKKYVNFDIEICAECALITAFGIIYILALVPLM